MNEIVENCQVEWNKQRGVLYVHNKDTGATILRIGGLEPCGNRAALADGQIDIVLSNLPSGRGGRNLSAGVSYPKEA